MFRSVCEMRTGLMKIIMIPLSLQNPIHNQSFLMKSRYCLGKRKDSKNSVSTETTATCSRALSFSSLSSDTASKPPPQLTARQWHPASDTAAITDFLQLPVSPRVIPSHLYSAREFDFWRGHWSSAPWHGMHFQILHVWHNSKQPWDKFHKQIKVLAFCNPYLPSKYLLAVSCI